MCNFFLELSFLVYRNTTVVVLSIDSGYSSEGLGQVVVIASARNVHMLSCGSVGECTGQRYMHSGKDRACDRIWGGLQAQGMLPGSCVPLVGLRGGGKTAGGPSLSHTQNCRTAWHAHSRGHSQTHTSHPGDEHYVLDTSLDKVSFALQ